MKTDENQVEEIIVPLGKALKDARLEASLSLEEVAEKLNLRLSTVRDLEDDLDEILATKRYPVIYLRGYLVNYAKLLGLSTLELFVEYKQLDTMQKQSKTVRAPRLIIPQAKKRSPKIPLLVLLVIVIAIIAYIFQGQLFSRFEQADSLATPPSNSVVVETTSINSTTEENSAVDAEEVDTSVKMVTQTSELVEKASTPAHKQTSLNESATQITEPLEQRVATTKTVANSTNKIAQAKDATPAQHANDEKVVDQHLQVESLTVSFSADCWTEIYDATGKRIAFGLYKEGRVLALSGIAPFKFKLGDPSVAEIQYQDQIIEGDFTPGRTAQFSVPLS